MKKTILITGANRGIGFALTKLCLSKDLYVEACCRNPDNSHELNNLSNNNPHLNITKMDVTSSKSILKALKILKMKLTFWFVMLVLIMVKVIFLVMSITRMLLWK